MLVYGDSSTTAPTACAGRRLHRDPGAEQLAVQHEPAPGHALRRDKAQRRRGILEQAGFARHARIAAIAAIFEHQHAVAFAGEPLDAVGAIADMAAIAVKIDDDRPLALARPADTMRATTARPRSAARPRGPRAWPARREAAAPGPGDREAAADTDTGRRRPPDNRRRRSRRPTPDHAPQTVVTFRRPAAARAPRTEPSRPGAPARSPI